MMTLWLGFNDGGSANGDWINVANNPCGGSDTCTLTHTQKMNGPVGMKSHLTHCDAEQAVTSIFWGREV